MCVCVLCVCTCVCMSAHVCLCVHNIASERGEGSEFNCFAGCVRVVRD